MHSDIGIGIDAPASLVYALARDVGRWSTLLPHYARSNVVARRPDGSIVADFVARRPLVPLIGIGLPVAWRSRINDEPETRGLSFVHVAGATTGMSVRWRIEPERDGVSCRVTISHDFSPRVPGFARFVDRFFTRPIAGRTLATFKALAEAVAKVEARDRTSPIASEPAPATKSTS
jgi:ribosome-associated toxin RatA of RatAB toxin-antitoxin module